MKIGDEGQCYVSLMFRKANLNLLLSRTDEPLQSVRQVRIILFAGFSQKVAIPKY